METTPGEPEEQEAPVTQPPSIEQQFDLEADISQLEAPTFTTINRGPPEPMLRLRWDHRVNLIGEKVLNPMIHCCDKCSKPILIYGRMVCLVAVHDFFICRADFVSNHINSYCIFRYLVNTCFVFLALNGKIKSVPVVWRKYPEWSKPVWVLFLCVHTVEQGMGTQDAGERILVNVTCR